VKMLSVAFPAMSLVCTAFMPAGLQLSFFVSSMLSAGQALLFKWPAFRTYWNMYPLPASQPDNPSPTPYPGTMRIRAPVLTTAELDRAYQSGRTSATETAEFQAGKQALHDVKPPGKESGVARLVPDFVKEATKDISGAVTAAKDMVGQGKDGLAQRQAKYDRKTADAYELKRQREIREARLEREEAKKAERARRASLKKR
jgi:YidC/Oxa1 family membrane protein insertase